MTPPNRVIGLFATPFLRVEQLLPPELIAALTEPWTAQSDASAQGAVINARSEALTHSPVQHPRSNRLFSAVSALVTPRVADFGELLFGERLDWHVKDMWLNALQTGGHQAVHNHANCFVSGVVYLSASHASAHTVFLKGLGGRDFAFSNAHSAAAQGPFNADKWIAPAPSPGDLVLFPSYLLHEVPKNEGPLRLSLAFNAIPARLDSWGYRVGFNDQQDIRP